MKATTQSYERTQERLKLWMEGTLDWTIAQQNASAVFESTGIAARAKRVGDRAPDVTLPDALGNQIRLKDHWRHGPLVVIFYRGGWCSYCNAQLRAWQLRSGDLKALNARLVAISPQTPDNSMTTRELNSLAYPILSDSDLVAAEGFDIAFTLPPELVDLYGSVGVDVPVFNGNGQWVLPVPATYMIDREGTIRFADVEEDIRIRPEPGIVLDAIERLR